MARISNMQRAKARKRAINNGISFGDALLQILMEDGWGRGQATQMIENVGSLGDESAPSSSDSDSGGGE